MIPPSERVLAETVTVGSVVSVIPPVVWVRELVPVKVKLPPIDIALVMVRAASTSSVPPYRVSVPEPSALLFFTYRFPPEMVTPEVAVLTGISSAPPLSVVAPV
jgi:hypothetical protein